MTIKKKKGFEFMLIRKEKLKFIKAKEDNFLKVISFLAKCNVQILQEEGSYSSVSSRVSKYIQEGIYYLNSRGEKCRISVGGYLVRDGMYEVKSLREEQFKMNYKKIRYNA